MLIKRDRNSVCHAAAAPVGRSSMEFCYESLGPPSHRGRAMFRLRIPVTASNLFCSNGSGIVASFGYARQKWNSYGFARKERCFAKIREIPS